MKKTTLALTLILTAAFASGCIITTDEDSSLTIDNASSFFLDDIAVRGSGDFDYGANLVGSAGLAPGESITVLLDCDTYDVLVTDEDGVTCELIGFDLCFDDALWVITNGQLNSCLFNAAPLTKPEVDPSSTKPYSGQVVDARKAATN